MQWGAWELWSNRQRYSGVTPVWGVRFLAWRNPHWGWRLVEAEVELSTGRARRTWCLQHASMRVPAPPAGDPDGR